VPSAAATAMAALGCLAIGAGCTRPNRAYVSALAVDAFEGGEVVALSQAQLRSRLEVRLQAAHFVVLKPGEAPPDDQHGWRLKLAVALTEPDAEAEQGPEVTVVLDLHQEGEPGGFEVRAHQPRAAAGRDVEAVQASAREALDAALGRVVREGRALIELQAAREEVLVARLSQSDEATRDAAVRLLVERKSLKALPALLDRLKTDDLSALRAAMGLLVELRAPQAVNPLIEATKQRGPVVQREVVFAVGAIGGEDAEAYLDLVASGHDDALVRASAEQALKELRSRRSAKGDSP
jgi:hypothetical protein